MLTLETVVCFFVSFVFSSVSLTNQTHVWTTGEIVQCREIIQCREKWENTWEK